MFHFTVLLCTLAVFNVVKGDDDITCQLPCKTPIKDPWKTALGQHCKSTTLKLVDEGRCCIISETAQSSTNLTIVGVDLTNCSLTSVGHLLRNMTSVVLILLEDNPQLTVFSDDFYQLTKLNYLSLPLEKKEQVVCPGGDLAWNNSVVSKGLLECSGQINTCTNMENNATCPSPQSTCYPAGPGLVDCLCSPGYHGYKCLRKGTFPVVQFAAGLGGSTVVLSLFLWVTQRRAVKKHSS